MAKLAIIYGTGFGNTGIMAKAIEEGARNAGIEVLMKKVEEASPADVERADAIVIGSPTYKGAGMPTVIKFTESLSTLPLKGKVGAAFGSYGWSGEAAGAISKKLKGYGMDVIEPDLRIKRIPEAEGIETCKELGKVIAEKLKNVL
ncbi:MAG: flavodoxin domain-containing protein [Candidatus Methanoperedens sp.]|nr:flavodoxin domain-containing protein [Candidatus Methanoperedens sp.]